jgi:hypothetical protein
MERTMDGRATVLLAWTAVATAAIAGLVGLVMAWAVVLDELGLVGVGALVLVALACCVDGRRGQAAALLLMVATTLLAPWYAAFAHGAWHVVLIAYGGQVAALALLALALVVHRAEASAPRRAARRRELPDLGDRTYGVRGV